MGRITDLLDAIDVAKENTEELYGIFHEVNDYDLPVIRFYLSPGTGLIRQRVNLKGKDFDKISELSYPPADCITRYERANLPFHPMFYACSFPNNYNDGQTPPPRVVSLLETSSFFRDKMASGIERSTVSRWEITKEVELVAMPFLADYSMECDVICNIKEAWNQALQENNVNPEGLELIEYMANEIGRTFKSNVEYFKIANFVNYLLNVNNKTKDVDGIIYPSVPAAGAGFNVALRPSAVDEKVKFIGASLCYLLKKTDDSYLHVVNHSVSAENGFITYEEMAMNDAEREMYERYAEGLRYRN